MLKKNCRCETSFDVLENGKNMFLDGFYFAGYIFIRENIDVSDIDNNSIMSVLMGDSSLYWTDNNTFFILDKINLYQKNKVEDLMKYYKSLTRFNSGYYEKTEGVNADFFKSVSPRSFNENMFYSVNLIKNFMNNIKGEFFSIQGNKLYFFNKVEMPNYNPLI